MTENELAAFAFELDLLKIHYTPQQAVPARYKTITLDVGFRADIIMDGKLVVEIKSVKTLDKAHHKTVLTYLRLSQMKLAILVNFNVYLIKDGIHRKIMGQLIK